MIFCVISLPQSWAECPSSESTVPTQLWVKLIQRSGVSISVQKHIFQSFEVSALYQAQRLNLGTQTPCLNIQCSSFFFIFAAYISRANLFILQKGTEVGGSLKSKQPKENKNVLIKIFFLATVGPIALFLKNLCDWLPLDFVHFIQLLQLQWRDFHHKDGFAKCLTHRWKVWSSCLLFERGADC